MKLTLFLALIVSLLIASCTKTSNNTGIAAAWVGNYDVAGTNDTINRVAVTEVNSNKINMAIEVSANSGTSFYSPLTIANAAVLTDSTASFDGYYIVNASPYAFHVVGTAQHSGNILTVLATYTDTLTHTSGPYQFRGLK
jgi:hypothetical protein